MILVFIKKIVYIFSGDFMKKLIVIGAGISGLSAGIYAARSGFDVTIMEQHFTFGGLSTGWSRKGYFFEGGMHWLTGSSEKLPMNRIWKETGALQENNPIENRDPLYTLLDGNKNLNLHRYAGDMEKALLEYAPEDEKPIKKMFRDVKAFSRFFMPVFDVSGCKCKNPAKISVISFIKMLPAVFRVPFLVNQSFEDYVNQFSNKNIRHLLMSVIGYRYNALSFIYTLGSFASGDCGYPGGGSIQMAKNMEQTFLSLGGKIEYRTPVDKVIVQDGVAKGVKTKNGELFADAVIVTQDTRAAVDNLFEEPLQDKWVLKMKQKVITEQNVFVCLGVKADLSHLPYACVIPLKEPLEYAGCKWNEIRINNYAKYKAHSPEGCTSITSLLIGDCYDFWKKAKADGTYKAKKDELGKLFVDAVAQVIPEVKENLEVIDVATPCTYERYCSSFEGSWMSVWKKGGSQDNYPQTLKSVKNVYFAGQRIMMPGGLPIAVYTGRRAVQLLCKDNHVEFV